jgi:molybdopterin-binding protein
VRLSTRNQLPGKIVDIEKGQAATRVSLQVEDNHVVALITTESAEELGLEIGQQVTALVKATDVMVLVDEDLE